MLVWSCTLQPFSRKHVPSVALQAGGWVWGACGGDRGGCRVRGLLSSGTVLLPCHPLSPAVFCLAMLFWAVQHPGLLQCWLLCPSGASFLLQEALAGVLF